ncbi:MAG: 3-oxoadipate CoA-transferase [Rhodospirillales bacterium 20-60-12]|jgi:3-oxoadipate CoA-transferase alpha subunit|nr:MAG: 3-oxoadipate CoA-transferase [Rhodospirillales bacterium 20-60-12]HQT66874.1 3-oxoacid CoA-transferase subunit A [Acetobacteraceae bacterium]HQU00964.1 3-oxoacid CoA-transferase subunit A [Acetobacteraceae bacterium]
MIDKFVPDIAQALAGIQSGATIMIGGFGSVGQPNALIDGLVDLGITDLTIIANNAGAAFGGLPKLMEAGAVRKVVCSYPRSADSSTFVDLYRDGKIELDLIPQGTLAERIRAAGAGVPAFFTPTGAGTLLARGKESREINGRLCVLEEALFADIALIEAWEADRWGNLTFNGSGRNFNPIMAAAGRLTIVQTQHRVELGALNPAHVMTPGLYVNRVLHVPYGRPIR